MIDAPGAIACAHSTSSDASPTMSSFWVVTPFWSTTWKLGGAGIPKYWSNVSQIGVERGVDPLLDDGDRLAGTVAGDGGAAGAGEADLVDAVGLPKLRGRDLAAEERQLAGDGVRSIVANPSRRGRSTPDNSFRPRPGK